MSVGNRIQKLRKEIRLTQKELAEKVNVSPQVISNWERGYTDPSHEDIKMLSESLGCSADYILGNTDVKSRSDIDSEYTLTDKDERDIAKRIKKMKADLVRGSDELDGLTYMGEPLSGEAIESLLEALEHAERIATLANKKYTPNKYKK